MGSNEAFWFRAANEKKWVQAEILQFYTFIRPSSLLIHSNLLWSPLSVLKTINSFRFLRVDFLLWIY